MKLIQTKEYLLLIDEAAVIEINDYILSLINKSTIIDICTDCDERAINGIAIKWTFRKHCSKIIAYYPLTKEAKKLELPLLLNPFKEQIHLQDMAETFAKKSVSRVFKAGSLTDAYYDVSYNGRVEGFKAGYEAVQPKQFTFDEMKKAIEMARKGRTCIGGGSDYVEDGEADDCVDWLYTENQIIQSLSTQQLPKEFIPDVKSNYKSSNTVRGFGEWYKELVIIINSEGKQELVGEYKY